MGGLESRKGTRPARQTMAQFFLSTTSLNIFHEKAS